MKVLHIFVRWKEAYGLAARPYQLLMRMITAEANKDDRDPTGQDVVA